MTQLKFTAVIMLVLISSSLYSQTNNEIKKFEAQIHYDQYLYSDGLFLYGIDARLNYEVSNNIFLGAGFLFSNDNENFYSPNVNIQAKFTSNKIAPYINIAGGPNFSGSAGSSPGMYFSLGPGIEYKANKYLGINLELSVKSFSYKPNTVTKSERVYYTYFSPSIGMCYKF